MGDYFYTDFRQAAEPLLEALRLDDDPARQQTLRDIKSDPSIITKWTWEEIHEFIGWFCAIHAESAKSLDELDLPVLHCQFSSTKAGVDDQLVVPSGKGVETALSLAIYSRSIPLVRYLLKMGASPDELVGWDPCTQRPGSFALDRAMTEQLKRQYIKLVLELCPRPCRSSPEEVMLNDGMDGVEFVQKVQDYQAVEDFTPGIEYDVAEARENPDCVERWSRLHCIFVFARLVKRRPSGPIPSDYFLFDLLLASGKVRVNDYLVGCGFERINALHEAVVAKNVDFVRYLLQKQKADPNVRSFVDGLPWNDITHIVYPLGVALRAFLVWDDGEQAAIKNIVNLLLDAGTRIDVQVETIDAISQRDVMILMNTKEALHFVKMVRRLVARDSRIFAKLHTPLSFSVPELLSACEQKWMKTGPEEPTEKIPQLSILVREGMELVHSAINAGSPHPRQECLMNLITSRSHQTLAALAQLLGDKLPLQNCDLDRIRFLNPYTGDHAEDGLTPQDIYTRDALRVKALISVIAKCTASSQKWLPLLNYLHTFILLQKPKFPADYMSLKNRCIGVVNDMVRQQRLDGKILKLKSIPASLWIDVNMEREFDILNSIWF